MGLGLMANMLSMPPSKAVAALTPKEGGTSPLPPAVKPNALATSAMTPQQSPYAAAAAPKPKQNALLGSALDGFMRGFRPQQWQADQDKQKMDGAERAKQTLALMQQQRQIPAEQRAQWWQQNADQIGQIVGADVKSLPMDANSFTDQALDGQIAMMSAKLGIAPATPEPMSAYQAAQIKQQEAEANKPQYFNTARGVAQAGPDGVTMALPLEDKPAPPNLPDGWQIGKGGQPEPIPGYAEWYRKMHPGDASGGGVSGAFRTMSPEEVRMRGYSPGTVVQVDGRGKEYVNARPSTAQTGQPTESERAAGLHTQVSLNGLRTIMSMEGGGYNRAGMLEQGAGAVGGIFGQGEKEKLYDQGAAEFIDGYLRAMTGAAATKSEIDTYRAQWFPQFGDSAPVMQQKARGRLNALEGMKSKAGRAWNPTWDGMITDLRNQLGATAGQSANPMQMATEGGSQTVPGLNWDQANMGTREDAAPTMSQDEMDELQQLRAEFGVQ